MGENVTQDLERLFRAIVFPANSKKNLNNTVNFAQIFTNDVEWGKYFSTHSFLFSYYCPLSSLFHANLYYH